MIFAMIIFSFAITILAFTWFNITNQLAISSGSNSGLMQVQLQDLSQNLFSTGYIQAWNSNIKLTQPNTWSIYEIGLTDSQGSTILDPNKLYTLISMANYDYPATKEPLGISYDYYITVTSISGEGSGINVSIGKNPSIYGALTVDVNKQDGILDNVPVIVTEEIWTNTTSAAN